METTNPTTSPKGTAMLKVTFFVFCPVLKREFFNVELHRSMSDAKLRASALLWTIHSVEAA
jgi:hypothetical protein